MEANVSRMPRMVSLTLELNSGRTQNERPPYGMKCSDLLGAGRRENAKAEPSRKPPKPGPAGLYAEPFRACFRQVQNSDQSSMTTDGQRQPDRQELETVHGTKRRKLGLDRPHPRRPLALRGIDSDRRARASSRNCCGGGPVGAREPTAGGLVGPARPMEKAFHCIKQTAGLARPIVTQTCLSLSLCKHVIIPRKSPFDPRQLLRQSAEEKSDIVNSLEGNKSYYVFFKKKLSTKFPLKLTQLKILKSSLVLETRQKICLSSENYQTSFRFFSIKPQCRKGIPTQQHCRITDTRKKV